MGIFMKPEPFSALGFTTVRAKKSGPQKLRLRRRGELYAFRDNAEVLSHPGTRMSHPRIMNFRYIYKYIFSKRDTSVCGPARCEPPSPIAGEFPVGWGSWSMPRRTRRWGGTISGQ